MLHLLEQKYYRGGAILCQFRFVKGNGGCFEKKGSSFHGKQKETKQGKWNVLDGESEGNFIFTRICDMGFAKKEAYDIVNKAEGCFFSPFLGGLIASPASKYLLD